MSHEITQEQLEEIRRLERSVAYFEEALKHASTYAIQYGSGWDLFRDLQKGYFRHREALEKARDRLYTKPVEVPARARSTRRTSKVA